MEPEASAPAPEASAPAPEASAPASEEGPKGFAAAAKFSFLLRHLKTAELKFVESNARLTRFDPNTSIYSAGEGANHFYVVARGKFYESESHPTGGQRLKRVHEGFGATFGSHEMIFNLQRKTSVALADERGTAWAIPKRVFDNKIKVSPSESKDLLTFMPTVPLLSNLNKEELTQLARAAKEIRAKPGENVCSKGDRAACLYALRKGEVQATQEGGGAPLRMKAPTIFGESALYSDEGMRVRQATITCADGAEAVLVVFATEDIEALLGFSLQGSAENALNQKQLESVVVGDKPIIATLSSELKQWMADQIEERSFEKGKTVFREGDEADAVYIIKRGTAVISTKAAGKVGECGPGKVFGELTLVGDTKAKRNASVIAQGPEPLRLLRLSSEVVNANAALDAWREEMKAYMIEVRKEQKRQNEQHATAQIEADKASGKLAERRAKERAQQAAKQRRASDASTLASAAATAAAGANKDKRKSTAGSAALDATAQPPVIKGLRTAAVKAPQGGQVSQRAQMSQRGQVSQRGAAGSQVSARASSPSARGVSGAPRAANRGSSPAAARPSSPRGPRASSPRGARPSSPRGQRKPSATPAARAAASAPATQAAAPAAARSAVDVS